MSNEDGWFGLTEDELFENLTMASRQAQAAGLKGPELEAAIFRGIASAMARNNEVFRDHVVNHVNSLYHWAADVFDNNKITW